MSDLCECGHRVHFPAICQFCLCGKWEARVARTKDHPEGTRVVPGFLYDEARERIAELETALRAKQDQWEAQCKKTIELEAELADGYACHVAAHVLLEERAEKAEAEVERLKAELHKPCVACGVLKDAPGLPDNLGVPTPLDQLSKKQSKFKVNLKGGGRKERA